MWSLLVLTALANPKKDLAAALKARDAKDAETALQLLDSALKGGALKPKQEIEARMARIEVITLHPDPAVQLDLLPAAHEDLARLGVLDPDGLWPYKIREEIPQIIDLTRKAIETAKSGEPKVCALVVPHHDKHSPLEVLVVAMECAVEIEDVSAAKALTRDLLAASEVQGNLDALNLAPVVASAYLTLDEDPKAKLARIDAAAAEADAVEKRIEAKKDELADSYGQRVADLETLRNRMLTTRINVLASIEGTEAEQKPLLEQILLTDPGNYSVQVMLGQVLLTLGDEEAGLARLDRAWALDPKQSSAPYAQGVYWVNKSIPVQQELEALPKKDPKAKELKAELDLSFGNARDALLKAWSAKPGDADLAQALDQVCTVLADKACLKKVQTQ
ncbi:MAG: hypothetical protein H6737_13485 [Alphaproteobacteria bacterium]|nr:hypothetical protein [Alphaproteobacteria bacterium]